MTSYLSNYDYHGNHGKIINSYIYQTRNSMVTMVKPCLNYQTGNIMVTKVIYLIYQTGNIMVTKVMFYLPNREYHGN